MNDPLNKLLIHAITMGYNAAKSGHTLKFAIKDFEEDTTDKDNNDLLEQGLHNDFTP
jgi:hypothetical protein